MYGGRVYARRKKLAEKGNLQEIETGMSKEEGLKTGGDFIEVERGRAEEKVAEVTGNPEDRDVNPDRVGGTRGNDGATQVTREKGNQEDGSDVRNGIASGGNTEWTVVHHTTNGKRRENRDV